MIASDWLAMYLVVSVLVNRAGMGIASGLWWDGEGEGEGEGVDTLRVIWISPIRIESSV